MRADGTLAPLTATLQIGAGVVQPNPAATPIPFDGARRYFSYDAAEGVLRFDELSIRAGLRGTINAMRHIGMLPLSKRSSPVSPVVADSTSWVRAPESGIVIPKVHLGSRVTAGQALAVIGDPVSEEEEPVKAPFDGIIIGHSKLPLAHEGDALFHVAAFKSVARAENRVEEFAAVIGP